MSDLRHQYQVSCRKIVTITLILRKRMSRIPPSRKGREKGGAPALCHLRNYALILDPGEADNEPSLEMTYDAPFQAPQDC
jgi:hypothetical protein